QRRGACRDNRQGYVGSGGARYILGLEGNRRWSRPGALSAGTGVVNGGYLSSRQRPVVNADLVHGSQKTVGKSIASCANGRPRRKSEVHDIGRRGISSSIQVEYDVT